jgi:hypothetical protein
MVDGRQASGWPRLTVERDARSAELAVAEIAELAAASDDAAGDDVAA